MRSTHLIWSLVVIIPGGVLPYMGHIGMCRCEGYGFQAVYSIIGYINRSVWVQNRLSFFTKLTTWLKILSRLRKPGIATQKYKQMKSASLNFRDSASKALIHDYNKTLLDIIILTVKNRNSDGDQGGPERLIHTILNNVLVRSLRWIF